MGEAMREAMVRTRADVVADAGLAIAGLTEGHWSGLMVLGCGTVSLGVATSSSSSTTSAVVPEGVPPQRESQPELELEPEPEPEPELDALGAQQELAPDQQRLDFPEPGPGLQRESQPAMSFRTKSGLRY